MLHLFGRWLLCSLPHLLSQAQFQSLFLSNLRSIQESCSARPQTLPCWPKSAAAPTWRLYRDRWLERVGESRRVAQPTRRIRLQTAALIAAEASGLAMDSSHWLISRSAGLRAAPPRDRRNRNIRERRRRCRALRAAALPDK